MLKPIIAALFLTTSLPALAAQGEVTDDAAIIVPADGSSTKAMDEMMSIFSKMFDTKGLPEPEPKRLELATVTASKLLPDGAYGKIIDDMVGGMLTPLFDAMPGLSDAEIIAKTGVSEEAVTALTEEKKAVVARIIDPAGKDRGKQFVEIMRPMISEAMAVIEPAMRTGLSRAYARKFNEAQLTAINSFFETPAGSAFARESFVIQADPEVLQATFKALPTLLAGFMGDEAKLKAKFDGLPKARELKDLSDGEMRELASALGVDVATLEEQRAIVREMESFTDESGTEPWYAEDAWTAAARKKIKTLEAKSNAAGAKYEAASEKYTAVYSDYEAARQEAIDAARERIVAEGWTPEPAAITLTAEEIPADAVPPPAMPN